MLRSAERAVFGGACAAVFCGFWGLSATPMTGLWIGLVPLLLVVLSYPAARMESAWPYYRKYTLAVTIVFTLMLPLVFKSFGLFMGVLVLITFILLHKYLHHREPRDYHHILLMAFFLLLAACSQVPDPTIGPVMLFFSGATLWTYLFLHIWVELRRAAAAQDDAVPPPVDISRVGVHTPELNAAIPSLWRHGLISGWSMLLVGLVALTVFFFLATPRMEAQFIRGVVPPNAETGIPSQVDLSFSGSINPDETVAMRVEFPDEPDGQYAGAMLWRATTYPSYMRGEWRRGSVESRIYDRSPRPRFSRPGRRLRRSATGRGNVVRQVVYLDIAQPYGLPCLPIPVEIYTEDSQLVWSVNGDETVVATESRSSLIYEVFSEIDTQDPAVLRQSPEVTPRTMPYHYETLTYHDLNASNEALAQSLTEGLSTPYDKAEAIRTWLADSGEFIYTLDIPDYGRGNPINKFLSEGRAGHCELFASAMALMLRSLSIPARVAGGFRGGEWDATDRVYLVRNSMAHLWVEAYFTDYGWVTFDPTPPADSLIRRRTWFGSVYSRMVLKSSLFWYRNVESYRGGISWSNIEGMTLDILRGDSPLLAPLMGKAQHDTLHPGLAVLTGTGLILASGIGAYLYYRARHRATAFPLPRLTADQRRAYRLYRAFRKEAARAGLSPDGKCANELLAELETNGRAERNAARRLVSAYHLARFGGGALGRDAYAELRALTRTLFARKDA